MVVWPRKFEPCRQHHAFFWLLNLSRHFVTTAHLVTLPLAAEEQALHGKLVARVSVAETMDWRRICC